MTKLTRPIAMASGMLLVTAVLGTGAAFAATHQTSPTPQVTATDAGPNVQSGDQTTADSPAAAETSSETSAATETATESGTSAEQSSPEADGAGGHADPAGSNVDHQFNGQE